MRLYFRFISAFYENYYIIELSLSLFYSNVITGDPADILCSEPVMERSYHNDGATPE